VTVSTVNVVPADGGQGTGSIDTPVAVVREPPAAAPAAPENVSRDAIERARQQEREKLYGRLDTADKRLEAMNAELETLRTEREARLAAEAQAQQAREKAEADKALAETSAKDLVLQHNADWEKRFAELQAERETERAQLAKEAEYSSLRAYTQEQVRLNAENIAPQLLDLVTGNSQEEVNASIELMKTKTSEILAEVQEAQTQIRSQMRGVSSASVPGAAIDDGSGTRTLTAKDIQNMSMPEYKKYRAQLGVTGNSNNRGLFD
jgi:DNA repair exonuclease SbcCD ATPase subunit